MKYVYIYLFIYLLNAIIPNCHNQNRHPFLATTCSGILNQSNTTGVNGGTGTPHFPGVPGNPTTRFVFLNV